MELRKRVESVIDSVRPVLEGEGGGIELVDFLEKEKVVMVNLTGACSGCPMSTMTIKGYVENALIEEIPEIKEVRLVN
jgi:Fe-S cluster biogenesis protein NfuA